MPAQGGVAVASGTIELTRGLPIEAEVRADGVDLAEVLDRLGVTGPWVTLRLQGGAKVSGKLQPPELAGTLAVDVRDFKSLTHSYKLGVRDRPVLAFARGRVESPVRVTREGLFLEGARVTVGSGAARADAAIHFSTAGGFSVQTRGEVDLGALGPVAGIPWSGRAEVEATVAAAPYGNPRITGHARAEGFHFLQVDLGNVAADLRYQDFLLHLESAQGARGGARYQGEVVVDLRSPAQVVSSRLEGRGRMRDMFDAVMEWLPRTRYLRDAMDGEVVEARDRPGARRRARRDVPGAARGGDAPRPPVRVRARRGADPGRPDGALRRRGAAAGRGGGAGAGHLGRGAALPVGPRRLVRGRLARQSRRPRRPLHRLGQRDRRARRVLRAPARPLRRERRRREGPGGSARDGPGRRHHRRAAPGPDRGRRGARPRRRGRAGGAPALHRERQARAGGRGAARAGRSARRPASAGGRARQRRGRPRGPPSGARQARAVAARPVGRGRQGRGGRPGAGAAPRRPARAAPDLAAQPVDRAHPGRLRDPRGRAGSERHRRRRSPRGRRAGAGAPPRPRPLSLEAHLGGTTAEPLLVGSGRDLPRAASSCAAPPRTSPA